MVKRTLEAAKKYHVNGILLGGGVAANTLLRNELIAQSELDVVMPTPSLCTDNGSMIGAAGYQRYIRGITHGLELDANPSLELV